MPTASPCRPPISASAISRIPPRTLKLAETLGIKVVGLPLAGARAAPDFAPMAGRRFGDKLQKIGKPFQDAGLTFGYHNHDFEFVTL